MSTGGKGDKPRPYSIPLEEFDNRWETIFGKKKKSEGERQAEAFLKDEYYDIEDNADKKQGK